MKAHQGIDRRQLLAWSSSALAFAAQPRARAAQGESFSLTVCPWTAENPRHDHAQIFPLTNGNLMLVWSEYYMRRPSNIFRTPYSKTGTGDQSPCRISARISRDRGRSWSGRITLQENIGPDNDKQPNLVRLPDGDVLFFFTSWDFAAQHQLEQFTVDAWCAPAGPPLPKTRRGPQKATAE